jgi:hypothetical protein
MDPLTVDEASRLAVTAVAADLEYWARSVADRGRIELDDLIGVLEVVRAGSVPAAVTHTSAANVMAGYN